MVSLFAVTTSIDPQTEECFSYSQKENIGMLKMSIVDMTEVIIKAVSLDFWTNID